MNRVKQMRVAKGIDSQRELADIMTKLRHAPMTFATISRLESGETDNPKYKTIKALADFFGVSVEYLMGDSDDPGYTLTIAAHQDDDEKELPPEAKIAIDTFYNKMKKLYSKD